MHESGLFKSFLVSLFMCREPRKVVLEFVLEGTGFIDLKVGLVFGMEQILSSFYIVPMIGVMEYEYLCGVLVDILFR